MKIPIDIKTGNLVSTDDDVIVGIDLGTTNSLVAYMEADQPMTIKSHCNQNSLTPSVLHFEENGNIIVGNEAKNYLISDPQNTIFSVKRLMGKSYKDVAAMKSSIGYEIIDEDKESLVKIRVKNKFYTPVELSAEILKSLRNDAQSHLKKPVTKAVITVPAYFNDAQRQATRDAGKLAGLDVLRIVNEPTAASLAYGIGLSRDIITNIAVYDLGGGTFDISILHLEDGVFDVLSTHGDTFLGGDDFDAMIISYWENRYELLSNEVFQNPNFKQKLRLAAETAKVFLSSNDAFVTQIDELKLELDKNMFESLTRNLVERTMTSVKQAIGDSGLQTAEIDKIILVGGSSRIPMIKRTLKDFFGKDPDDSINPDEVVALGAAIQADILAGNRKDILLLDVTPLSLGIETIGGLMDTIIPRNSKVPARAGRQYTTSVDGQTNLRISVFQGERDLVQHNRKLGEFVLKNIPPMVAGLPKIEVHFIIDADGILTVKAKELRSGTTASIDIRSTYGISEEEMALMLLDSIKNAETDVRKRAILEAINEANNILHSTEKFISQNTEILSESEIGKLRAHAVNLSATLNKDDKDQIHAAIKALNDYSIPLAHRALDTNITKALKGVKV